MQHNVFSFHFGTWLPIEQCFCSVEKCVVRRAWMEGKTEAARKTLATEKLQLEKWFRFCSSVLPLIRKVWTVGCPEIGTGPLNNDRLKVGIITSINDWTSLFQEFSEDTCNDPTRTSPLAYLLWPCSLILPLIVTTSSPRPSRRPDLVSTVSLVLPLMGLLQPASVLTLLSEPHSIVTLRQCGSISSSNCVCISTCCLMKRKVCWGNKMTG